MHFPDHIEYKLEGEKFELPRMFRARQIFPRNKINTLEQEVSAQLNTLPLPPLSGKRICLTGSSRGIDRQAVILKTTADWLKQQGALPFLVPGMGSHGGASAPGQRAILAEYDITEKQIGIPIQASMDVVQLGTTGSGFSVYCDAAAANADYILPVNRIKPHSEFKGPIESGLCKMMVIGLGKHKGCSAIHALGVEHFPSLIPEAAHVFIESGKILAGLGIVENAFDEVMHVEAIPAQNIPHRETELLALAKSVMPAFYTDHIDVLIIEEIGKNIGGGGMDTNITGRPASGMPGFDTCSIRRIVVLNISEESQGNGSGMGMADVVTVDFMKQLDLAATYTNHFASRIIEGGKIPVVANNDQDAVRIALHCSETPSPSSAKVIQITNTLRMSDLLMSEAYWPEVAHDSRFEIITSASDMLFDNNGRLARL